MKENVVDQMQVQIKKNLTFSPTFTPSMRIKLLLAGLLAVLFISCNRSTVTLDYTNAKDEVPPLGNLSFHFSNALVPDSLLNNWDSTEYVSFSPAIPGRFRWEHPDELVFSPSRPLPPATSFQATVNDDVLDHSKYGRIKSGDKIQFRTPDLKLENSNFLWVLLDEGSKKIAPQVDLYFNYPVDPNALKDKLEIAVEGKRADFTLLTLSADNKQSVRLLNIAAEDKSYSVNVSIGKGLTPQGGNNSTTDAITQQSYIASPFELHVNDISSEHDGTVGTVEVKTSQQIADASLSSYIAFEPAVKFSTQLTDDGFLITSENFDASKSYRLVINKGLKGKLGGVLRESYDNSLAFGELEPAIRFANNKAVYLAAQGEKNIEVKITNVPKVKVVVSKIYENNLVAIQRNGYYPKETKRSKEEQEEEYYDADEPTAGDVIYEKELDTRSLPQSGNNRLFHFSIADQLPDFKGIYHIMIRSMETYWVRDSRFISVSDLGLIAKEGKEKMIVFANSIKTAEPRNGVNILVYGNNNQLLGMGPTNAEGLAEIQFTRKEFAGFRPAMIIAKTADDFNYLPFSSTAIATSRFEVGGKTGNSTGLDAFIYGERDIYRPGEQVNFSVVLRDRQWKAPGELPLKMKFLLPNGKELKNFRKNLNEQGAAEGNVQLSPSAITGNYSLEVYTSNDVLLGTKSFQIEEFVPDRIKVTATLNKPFLRPGDATQLQISAINFFGPPAANRNYETEIQIKQKPFYPKNYNRYTFELANQNTFFDKIVNEGKTDENGQAAEQYVVPATYSNMGLLQASFFATVFDETGRPVSRRASADIITQNIFLGLGWDRYGYYPLHQAARFPLLAVDRNEALVNGTKAQVKVIKHEYRTVLSKSGSYFNYQSQKQDKIVADNIVTISGENTSFPFVPATPGEYEIRLSLPGVNSYVSRSFYSYGSWGGDNSSFEVNTDGNIDIRVDKASYQAGEAAKVLFSTPFSGKMLVTLETDRVVSHQYINVDKRSATLDLKLTGEHVPNVYITATLIKPHGISDIPLTVAHGFQSVTVEEPSRKMGVEIMAQKTVRSKTHQRVTVKAAAGSYVTLAAVDNGVLQVTDYKTPDPYGYFYAKRALEVKGYDLYPLLFPEIKARLSSTGGDADLEMSKRTNPMPNKRIKIVSYWSGIVQAGGSGQASFEFDVPAFSGQIRLMAVAYKNESFGSAETAMTVADPIILSTALPRFLSPSDTINVPVTVSNTTTRSSSAVATIRLSGPLSVVGNNKTTVNLPANSEGRALFRVVAAPATGTGKVAVEVQGMGEKFTSETEISIRPASTLQKLTGSGSLAGNSSGRIAIGLNDFMPASMDYSLTVSRSPAVEVAGLLKYLVQYPYGCTEQVISSAFPQLYFGEMAELIRAGRENSTNANYNIQEAIRKIKMRQLYNGAILLWDDEKTENWWASVYAAQFLLEAQKAGYDVDASLLDPLLGYINNRLKTKLTISYYYNGNQVKKIAPKEIAYSLYVLAMASRPNISVMNYYKANPQLLSLDSRYMLSAAFATAGDRTKFRELLPTSFSGEESVPQSGGSFYSAIRDEAVALNVLIDVDPTNAQIPVMARQVINKLKQRSWYSTQESAFSFLAIGKMARSANKSTVTADIKVNGKSVSRFDGKPVLLRAKELGGTNVEIATKGEGQLYYWWQSEGISASGSYKEEDNYIQVRRKFFDRLGTPVSGNSFPQNSLVIVQVIINKSYSGTVENVAITDLLPAGFEIENPRTKEIPGMDWIKDADTPTQLDVRDDRINLFVDLTRARQVYYYAVRAISPGVFRMGPVSADALYNGEYHSYNGAGTIQVRE
ncbi:MAG: alpha-2-macroglobulin family protein [Williamsia sp.]|nr:alpha-2-macroglobulin family protein [Williamsia sp.]